MSYHDMLSYQIEELQSQIEALKQENTADKARIKELEDALRSTLKRCKMIELPQNYGLFHSKADTLLKQE